MLIPRSCWLFLLYHLIEQNIVDVCHKLDRESIATFQKQYTLTAASFRHYHQIVDRRFFGQRVSTGTIRQCIPGKVSNILDPS